MAETVTTIQQPAPIFEEGAKSYLDLLTAQTQAAGALKPLGDTPTTRAEGFAPGVESQGALEHKQHNNKQQHKLVLVRYHLTLQQELYQV